MVAGLSYVIHNQCTALGPHFHILHQFSKELLNTKRNHTIHHCLSRFIETQWKGTLDKHTNLAHAQENIHMIVTGPGSYPVFTEAVTYITSIFHWHSLQEKLTFISYLETHCFVY